ncbi:hypothetical protein WKI13_01140 [Teredinibacter turnerae]|uniref:hypothetical protein n=1 Tax=Teredinibacter turnerae TaxID=2426 RepID=UPI00036FA047|nr:hypothetical protein [Teredinibacter turnerae]
MDTSNLSGIVVVIDDEVDEKDTNINKLVESIKDVRHPCLTYNDVPDIEMAPHLSGAPFIVLDWQLCSESMPSGFQREKRKEQLDFITKLKETCFCPIFIYTNSDIDEVKSTLRKKNLINDDLTDSILIRHKTELEPEKVLEAFSEWVTKNPAVHTLVNWENTYEKAKNNLFSEFYSLSHAWPKVLWDTYKNDGADPSEELGSMITRNLHSRMQPFRFDENVFGDEYPSDKTEIRKVLSGEKFLTHLGEDTVRCGDVFKIGGTYYINVRPDCDCVLMRSSEDLDLYLLKLQSISANKEKNLFNKNRGNFDERDDECIVFNMFNQKTFAIKFKQLKIIPWGECSKDRKGRLLPPYITRTLQRYSLYMQRAGFPKTPEQAIFDAE